MRGNTYARPFCFAGEHGIKLDVSGAEVVTAVMAFEMDEIYPRGGIDGGGLVVGQVLRPLDADAGQDGRQLPKLGAGLGRGPRRAGYDEAILLDMAGNVSEASGENVFVAKGGRLYTPPASSSALEGITRDTVLQAGSRGPAYPRPYPRYRAAPCTPPTRCS